MIPIEVAPWQPLPNGREVEILVRDKGKKVNQSNEGVDLPTLAVVFNPKTGGLQVTFDTLDFPSWEVVAMMLHGAYEHAMAQIRVMQSLQLRNMVAQAEQQARLVQEIERNPKGKILKG